MRRLWFIGLAAGWNGLRPLQVEASKQFELPETLEDLAQQIDFFENPLFQQIPGCRSIETPFLLRYDTLQNGTKVPVCASESQILARRLDLSLCNTKVTLGEKVDGGCSQYNFFRGVVPGAGYLDDFADLTEDNIVAVPMHRNVPFYHGNTESSPEFPTQEYYHEAEYLPCELEFNFEDDDSADKLQTLKQQDLDDTKKQTGYCDTDPVVKEKLCWSGSGADASVDQSLLVNGSYFGASQPCDVMQHAEPRATASAYKRLSIHTPSRHDKLSVSITGFNRDAAVEEAIQQNCVQDGITHLDDLENATWYTGNDPENTATKDYWTKSWRNNYDICRFKRSYKCFDKEGNTCTSDDESCNVYNALRYTITGVNNCLRKTISRDWTGTVFGKNRRVATRRYTAAPKNAEKYFSATSTTGANACASGDTPEDCKNNCYKACKAMKYPAFSVTRKGDNRCVCRDYASEGLCPAGQWISISTYASYAISPRCSSTACNRKTVYEENLKPCQFTPVYRKRKCMETCAAKNSLFMTISESGLCMCSKAERRRANNAPVRFQSGQVCPWSTSVRVYKDKENKISNKGYLGDSYVSNTPVETYQLKYASYFDTDQTPEDGFVFCEKGSPTQEIYAWFAKVTGGGFLSGAVSIEDVKRAYQNLNTDQN